MTKTKGLSLAEAHATGKAYQRESCQNGWYRIDSGTSQYIHLKDALATDYMLKPEAKLLTREEVGGVMFLQLNISTMDRQRVLDKLFGSEEEA